VVDTLEIEQIKRLNTVCRKRSGKALNKCLKSACEKGENVMPFCIEAPKEFTTIQEICDACRKVYGEFPDAG
jgi:methylmalonyl-CoA mutase N-terminal domain/subunit